MLELENPLVCYLSQAAWISFRYEGTLTSQQEIEYFITLVHPVLCFIKVIIRKLLLMTDSNHLCYLNPSLVITTPQHLPFNHLFLPVQQRRCMRCNIKSTAFRVSSPGFDLKVSSHAR